MSRSYICDYVRTPIGRYGGGLSSVRPDDLCAHVLRTLIQRNSQLPDQDIDEVWIGCANQAGEDNRNIARMSLLLAGLSVSVPAATINRLCGSGMDAVLTASRAISAGFAEIVLAGGVESMSRAPFVVAKADTAFSRRAEIHDTTLGWRFVNPLMDKKYGTDSMPETADNVANEYSITRLSQDEFALASQRKAAAAIASGRLAAEITPVTTRNRRKGVVVIARDEHPRTTSAEKLAALPTLFAAQSSVTAGNSSGINDGAAALLIASEKAVRRYSLEPLAEIVGGCSAGVQPRVMGIGPVYSTRRLLRLTKLTMDDFDLIELNEAFASQCLAVMKLLGIEANSERLNINGGAIALGHPLGMSGARIVGTAALELALSKRKLALATMCIGVGQGISLAMRRC